MRSSSPAPNFSSNRQLRSILRRLALVCLIALCATCSGLIPVCSSSDTCDETPDGPKPPPVSIGTEQRCSCGYCWENPLPDGSDFFDIWGADANHVWAVGSNGSIVMWDGTKWLSQTANNFHDLYGIWGSSLSEVLAIGDEGTILKWDGVRWKDVSVGSANYRSIWGASKDSIWVVGEASEIIHWNGSRWIKEDSGLAFSIDLKMVWGVSENSLWAVGSNTGMARDGFVLHRVNGTWSIESKLPGQVLYGIWGSDQDSIWIWGSTGNIYRRSSSTGMITWSPESVETGGRAPSMVDFYDINQDSTGSIWAVGHDGVVYERESSGWKFRYQLPERNWLQALWSVSNSMTWTVGRAGALIRQQGSSWKQDTRGVLNSGALNASWGTDNSNIWAVGSSGQVLHWDGRSWTKIPSDTSSDLHAIWGSAVDDIWIFGVGGTNAHWDGMKFTKQPNFTTEGIYSAHGSSKNNLWVTGSNAHVERWDGKSWNVIQSRGKGYYWRIWVADKQHVWAVGSEDFGWFDGSNWNQGSISNEDLESVWGFDKDTVFSGGKAGKIYKWSIGTWQPFSSLNNARGNVVSLWGARPNGLWAATAGQVFFWDGASWFTTEACATKYKFYSIWGTPQDDLWLFGPAGMILRRHGQPNIPALLPW